MKDHPLSIRTRSAIGAGFATAFSFAGIGLWLNRGDLSFLLGAAMSLLAFLVLLVIFVRSGDGK